MMKQAMILVSVLVMACSMEVGDTDIAPGEADQEEATAEEKPGAGVKNIGPRCEWHRAETLGTTVQLACPDGDRPISGACYSATSTSPVERSHVYENGSFSNLPDEGEDWDGLDGETGWYCQRPSEHAQWKLFATVLCCGQDAL